MKYLTRLLRGGVDEALKSLDEHIRVLKAEVLRYMSTEKYTHLVPEDAAHLSLAIMNTVFLYDLGDNLTTGFSLQNSDMIANACKSIKDDCKLCGENGGISYLMAAEMMKYGAIAEKNEAHRLLLHSAIRLINLLNKHAIDFQIWIPGKSELGYSNDPWEAADNIGHFALRYTKEKQWVRRSKVLPSLPHAK